jgi:uncharacterized membrane protein YqiK
VGRVKARGTKRAAGRGAGGGPGQATRANAAAQASTPSNQAEALRLRQDAYSYQQIADALGVSIATAHKWVKAALEEIRAVVRVEAEAVRELEDARLDVAARRLMDTVRAGTPDQATRASQALVRVSESRRHLWGVDLAPPPGDPPAEVTATVVIGGARDEGDGED